MNPRTPDDEIENAILRYLDEHPQAMDTLEGIARWWLSREDIRVDDVTLERSLRRMTEQRLLECFGSGRNARYRRRRPESQES